MPSTLPAQKRARLAQPLPLMPVWTSLPYDLVHDIGGRLLFSNDIDAYMAFRAICHEWRSITKEDSAKAQAKAGDDTDLITRFEPTKWALLDRHDDLITLVNVDSGRILCKRIPLLRRFFFVGATSGGLILLGESTEPHRARVLNPFTGSIVHFMVRIPCEGVRAVAIKTKPPLTVFIYTTMGKLMWADQIMETFEHFSIAYPNQFTCMTSFGGNVYAIDRYGSIYLSNAIVASGEPRHRCAMKISMDAISPGLDTTLSGQGPMSGRYYLVESAGELLLVTKPSGFIVKQPLIRKVNTETQKIEQVGSIGNRALFISHSRCLSIDANKFPSIQGGSVYFLDPIVTRGRYAAADRTIIHVGRNTVKFDWFLQGSLRPFTLAKVLGDYCRFVHYSELYEMMANQWDRDLSDAEDFESDESSSSEESDDEESSSSEVEEEEASCPEVVDD